MHGFSPNITAGLFRYCLISVHLLTLLFPTRNIFFLYKAKVLSADPRYSATAKDRSIADARLCIPDENPEAAGAGAGTAGWEEHNDSRWLFSAARGKRRLRMTWNSRGHREDTARVLLVNLQGVGWLDEPAINFLSRLRSYPFLYLYANMRNSE